MIRVSDARRVAEALHERYEPIRAVALVSRVLQKALFAGQSDEVFFWACVFAHYRGNEILDFSSAEADEFRRFILPEPDETE